jgi:hypothetical protein
MKIWSWTRRGGFLACPLSLLLAAGLANAMPPAEQQFVGDAQLAKTLTAEQKARQQSYNQFRNWANPAAAAELADPEKDHSAASIVKVDKSNIAQLRAALAALTAPPTPPDIIAKVTALLGKINKSGANAATMGDLNPLELLALEKYYFKDNQIVIPPKNTIQIVDSHQLAKLAASDPSIKDKVIAYQTKTIKKETHVLTPVYTTIWTYFPS